MAWLLELHLIRLFNFYLVAFFLIGTYVRWRQYQIYFILLKRMPDRWPRLMRLVQQHRHIFVTWGTVLPLVLMLGLLLLNWLALRFVWPDADFTLRHLLGMWPALIVVALCGSAMVGFDIYSLARAGTIDQPMLERYFDQAEYWLRSWVAPVVRFFTFGRIHPRRMVAEEVRKALESASVLLNTTVWWIIVQTGLRIAYGLSLWVSYFVESQWPHSR
jgi:hypothetical protein